MKCEFCERTFEKGAHERVLRGKRHVFCSESCFNLWFYKVNKFDMERLYTECGVSVRSDIVQEVLEEAEE